MKKITTPFTETMSVRDLLSDFHDRFCDRFG